MATTSWTHAFDLALKRYYAIDHQDAGLGTEALDRYSDLLPETAALQFGEDYDMERFDHGWR